MIKNFNIKFKVKNEILALTILIILTSIFSVYHNQTKNKINKNYKKLLKTSTLKKQLIIFLKNSNLDLKKFHIKLEREKLLWGSLNITL